MSAQSEHPATWQRTTGWGEALLLEIHLSPGLSPIVRACNAAAGDQGVRNTYARLYAFTEPPTDDDPKDRFRAWLVLTALGQDPTAWGIADDAVPAGYDVKKLRRLVTAASGWFRLTADLAAAS
jgi:hypothetical protein